jgi:hypothetical protein
MDITKGDNVFRALSPAIDGWEYWTAYKDEDGKTKRKPHRVTLDSEVPTDELGFNKWGNRETPKVFWAFVVYNRAADAIQILQITTKTVREQIGKIVNNKKWGNPKEYDIVISKEGDGMETTYTVNPEPKEKLDPEIIKRYEAMKIDLNALYRNEDPFALEEFVESEVTPEQVDKMMNDKE